MTRFVLIAVLLAGCAPRAGTEAIRYERGGGFVLGCTDALAVLVRPDGSGEASGCAARGRFRATPAQVRAFAERLAPYRPSGDRRMIRVGPECDRIATDQQMVEVWWSDGAHLVFYAGCDMEKNTGMRAALDAAPDALPIARFTGPRRAGCDTSLHFRPGTAPSQPALSPPVLTGLVAYRQEESLP